MQVKTKAIVISALKYHEKSLIVKCFTQSDGLKSYFVRNAFASGKTSQKIAYFQPLTILEIDASHKNKGTLEHFKEITRRINGGFNGLPDRLNRFKAGLKIFSSTPAPLNTLS